MFGDQAECEEFFQALVEFRTGRKIETHHFEGGKTERDVTNEP